MASNFVNINNNSNQNGDIETNDKSSNLRFIVIDASNVAREHGNSMGRVFSCRGIKLAVDHFLQRGHRQITALLPRFRRGNSDKDCPTVHPEILDELEQQGYITYTPSRYVENKLILPYDDRFILKAACHYDAIIVSNDNYRDLTPENPDWKRLVDKNLLQYSFIGDLFLIADDPMGRKGPKIDEFLSINPVKIDKFKNKKEKQAKEAQTFKPNFKSQPSNQFHHNHHQQQQQQQQKQIQNNQKASFQAGSLTPFDPFKRTLEQTTSLYDKLIEIFPMSKEITKILLNQYPSESNIDFFFSILLDQSN